MASESSSGFRFTSSHCRGSLLTDERDRLEACTVGFIAQMLKVPKRRPVAGAAGIGRKRPASSDEEARPGYGLGMSEPLKSARVAVDRAPVFGPE
jgi:hypothetical protein